MWPEPSPDSQSQRKDGQEDKPMFEINRTGEG